MNLEDLQNRIASLFNQGGQAIHNFVAPPQQPNFQRLNQPVNTQNMPYTPYQNPQTGNAGQSAQLKIGQPLPPLKLAQNILQPISNAGNILNQNIQMVRSNPQFAQQLPNMVNQGIQKIATTAYGNNLPAQVLGKTVGGLEQGVTSALTTPFTKKPAIEKAGDVLSGVGAAAFPGVSVGSGAVNAALQAGASLLQKKFPDKQSLVDAFGQGVTQGNMFGPINSVANVVLNPILTKFALNPTEVKTFWQGIRSIVGQGITGGVGQGAYGAMLPAKNTKERLQNIGSNTAQGFAFGAGNQGLNIAGGKAVDFLSKHPPGLTVDTTSPAGKELTVYRGEGGHNPASKYAAYGDGKYYYDNPDSAATFGKVTTRKISLHNPLDVTDQKTLSQATDAMVADGYHDLASWARAKGYDGLIDNSTGVVVDLSGKPVTRTLGEIQQRNQQATELAPLVDFEKAQQANDQAGVRKALSEIMAAPDGSKLATYKSPMSDIAQRMGIDLSQTGITQEANYKPLKISQPPDIVAGTNNLDPLGRQQGQEVAPGAKERGFITTIKESPNAPQQLKDLVSGTYDVKANRTLLDNANARIAQDPVAATQFATGTNNDEATATAVQLVKQLSMQGNHQAAADIVNTKAAQLTEAGRTIQAASLFDSLSPEGVAQLAARTIQHYNQTAGQKIPELTGQQLKLFTDEAAAIKQLPTGSREQDMARQKLLQSIAQLLPSSVTSKALGIWRAGLLTGPQTVTKIGVSHAAMLALEKVKDIPATMADSVASLLTGKRSMTPTLQGMGAGAKQGTVDAFDNLLKGYEAPNSGGFAHDFKNQTNYGNSFLGKVAQAYVDGVGRLHGSLYKPFYGAAHLNSLYDQALTEAGNNGLTGEAKNNFVLNFVKDATPEALKIANRDASYATFQQKTLLGSAASTLQRNLGPVGKIIAPFTRIPSAIITDAVDYTPVGIAKNIIQAANRGQFTIDSQRQLVQGLGRGITGTALIAIGAALYKNGLISLDRPQTGKAAAQWDLEGRKQQSIKIDGQWKNLAALGPLGHVLGVGGYFQQGLTDPTNGGVANALGSAGGGLARITLDQPYLTQVSDISQAVQQPQQKGLSEAKSLASSVIPTLSGTVARAIDPLQRQTNTVLDAMQAKIPGARQGLLPKTNALGENMQRSGGVVQNLLDPFQSYTDTSGAATNNPVVSELGRLDALGLSATPAKLTADQTIAGMKQKLTPAQLTTLNQAEGAKIQQSLSSLIQSSDYQKLTDEEKQNAINSVVTAIRKQVRGTIDLASPQSNITSSNQPTNNLQFTIINPATGGVRQIDLSTPITSPALTGNTNLDKKLVADFNSSLSSRANDIVTAYQNNKIDAATAEQMLQDIINQKVGTAKKAPKISLPKITSRKITIAKMKSHRLPAIKISAPKVTMKARAVKQTGLSVPKASFSYKIASPSERVFSSRRRRQGLTMGTRLV